MALRHFANKNYELLVTGKVWYIFVEPVQRRSDVYKQL